MKILTSDNLVFNMNEIPEKVDDIRYCVLDYSNTDEVDYFFMPLIFLESFNSPCADLRIGKHTLTMPLDWSVLIGDKHLGDIEVMPLTHLNGKDFETFVFNPIKGYLPSFLPLEVANIYSDVKWYFPKLKFGHLLAIPLTNQANPPCAFFVKDSNKLPDILDIRKLF